MQDNVPKTVIEEMFRKLRDLEDTFFGLAYGERSANDDEPNEASKAYDGAAVMLQNELDTIELHLSDLGIQSQILNELSVGREVARLFTENPEVKCKCLGNNLRNLDCPIHGGR
jgi:hypothetical protein